MKYLDLQIETPIDRFGNLILMIFILAAFLVLAYLGMCLIREIKNTPLLDDDGQFVDRDGKVL